MSDQGTRTPERTWWAPVWRGLVVDPNRKHHRQMGSALWLYLYLILHAKRDTGLVRCRLQTISRSTGIALRTIQRWLQRLRREGYVSVKETGRVAQIGIIRWKATRSRSGVAVQHRQFWRGSRQS